MNLDRAYDVARQSGMEETEIGIRTAIHKARIDYENAVPLDSCEPIARAAAERAQRVLGEQHEITLFTRGVLGQMCQDTGRTAEAEVHYKRLEDGVRRPGLTLTEPAVPATVSDYASVLRDRGDFARAETLSRLALTLAGASKHRVVPFEAHSLEGLAEAMRRQGKWDEVAALYEGALAHGPAGMWGRQWQDMLGRHAEALRRLGSDERAAGVERQLQAAQAALAAAPASTPAALTRRAGMRIRVGQFKEAAEDSARAIELDPGPIEPWYFRGCLLAYLRDEPSYRSHCDDMLKRFDRGAPDEVEETAKTSLLLAGTPHLAHLNTLLDRAPAGDAGTDRAWNRLAKAMAQYRAGQFDACIRTAAEAAAGLDGHDAAGKSTAELFAAMAHYRLRHDKSGPMLDELTVDVEPEAPKAGAERPSSAYTVDWLILQVALREAQALIRAQPPARAVPGITIPSRSLTPVGKPPTTNQDPQATPS